MVELKYAVPVSYDDTVGVRTLFAELGLNDSTESDVRCTKTKCVMYINIYICMCRTEA